MQIGEEESCEIAPQHASPFVVRKVAKLCVCAPTIGRTSYGTHTDKARLISKQETDQGIRMGVSGEIQDEILKRKYRIILSDSEWFGE